MTKASDAERDEYAADLRERLKRVSTIYTHDVGTNARSQIRLSYAAKGRDGSPVIVSLTYSAAKAMGVDLSRFDGLPYGGYGYNREFQAVYALGRALYPDGYRCTGKNCRSNDHTNGKPRDGRSKHSDGGYRFGQVSL